MLGFDFIEMLSAFIVLFAVIDILGSIPIVLDIRDKEVELMHGRQPLFPLSYLLFFCSWERLSWTIWG